MVSDNSSATGTAWEWVNQPAGSTEIWGLSRGRKLVDLTHLTEYFFSTEVFNPAGAAGAVLNLEYTTDLTGASGWTSMAGGTLSLAAANAWVNTGWVTVPTGAKAVVLLRVVGSGGNGSADPKVTNVAAQFRGPGVMGPTGPGGAASTVTGPTGPGGTVGPTGPAGSSYTTENAQDDVAAMAVDTATIDVTYTDATPELKWDVKDDSITYAKMQNVSATDKVIGRATAGAGDPEEITFTSQARQLADDTSFSAMRTTLGLEIGTNVQAWDEFLDDLAGLTHAADKLPYMDSATTAAVTDFSSFARTLLDDTSAATARATLDAAQSTHNHTVTRHQAVVIGDGTNDITTSTPTPDIHFPTPSTITKWRILAKQSGTIQLDLWKDSYANYPPTVADTITASAKPALSAATKNENSTLTGWTTALSAGDTLRINIDSVSAGLKQLTFAIEYTTVI